MTAPLDVSPAAARRFMRAALRFDAPHADVATALAYHGFVQLDPINVCGRMHDLILRNRVAGYREHDLLRHLYGADFETAPAPRPPDAAARGGFEHYAGNLVALPWDAWPFLQDAMERRRTRRGTWGGKLTKAEAELAAHILAELAARGPLTSDDIEHDGRATTAWGTNGRAVKTVLEKLFFHGRVLITTRRNFRRVYDLPERVVPAEILRRPRPTPKEAARWHALLGLRQRRLAALKRDERARVAPFAAPVRVAGCPPLQVLREDLPLLERCIAATAGATTDASETVVEAESPAAESRSPVVSPRVSPSAARSVLPSPGSPLEGSGSPLAARSAPRLLAPLDPLIYDRRVTRGLWNFAYTWEVYTPPAKRVRGYYALPVLVGDAIVGHVDPKADRLRGRLVVVSRCAPRGVATAEAVRELAAFLGLRAR